MTFSSGSNDNKMPESQKPINLQQAQQNSNISSANYQQHQISPSNLHQPPYSSYENAQQNQFQRNYINQIQNQQNRTQMLQQQNQQNQQNQQPQYNQSFNSSIQQNQTPNSQQQQLYNQQIQQVQRNQHQQQINQQTQYNQQMQYGQQKSVRPSQNQQINPQATSIISSAPSYNQNAQPYKSMENFQRLQQSNIPQVNIPGLNLNTSKPTEQPALSPRQGYNNQSKPANIPGMSINSGKSTDNYFPSSRLPPPNQNRPVNIPGLNINIGRSNDTTCQQVQPSNQNLQSNVPGMNKNINSGRSNESIPSKNIPNPNQRYPTSIPGLNMNIGRTNDSMSPRQNQQSSIPGLNPNIGRMNDSLSPRQNQQSSVPGLNPNIGRVNDSLSPRQNQQPIIPGLNPNRSNEVLSAQQRNQQQMQNQVQQQNPINNQLTNPNQIQSPSYNPQNAQQSNQNQTTNNQIPIQNKQQINQQNPVPKQGLNEQTQNPIPTQKQPQMIPPIPFSKQTSVDQFPNFQQTQAQTQTPAQNQQQINQQIPVSKQIQTQTPVQSQQQINQQIPVSKQTSSDQFPTYQKVQIPTHIIQQIPVSKRGSVDQFPTFQPTQAQTQNQQQINQQIPVSKQASSDQFPSYQQVQKYPQMSPQIPVSKGGSVDQFPSFQQNQQQINQQNLIPKQRQNDQLPTFQQVPAQKQPQMNPPIPISKRGSVDQFPTYQQTQPQTQNQQAQKYPQMNPQIPISKRGSVDQFPTFQQNQQQAQPQPQTQNQQVQKQPQMNPQIPISKRGSVDQFPTYQQTQTQPQTQQAQNLISKQGQNEQFPTTMQKQPQMIPPIPVSKQASTDQFPTYQQIPTPKKGSISQFPSYQQISSSTQNTPKIPISKRASFDLTNLRQTSNNSDNQSLDNFPSFQQNPKQQLPSPNTQNQMKLPPRPRFLPPSPTQAQTQTQQENSIASQDSPFPSFNQQDQNQKQLPLSRPRISTLPHPQSLKEGKSANTSSIHLQKPKFIPIEQGMRSRSSMFVHVPSKIENETFNTAIEDKSTWLNLEFSENTQLISLHERALPLVGGISFSNVKHADRVTSNAVLNRHTILEMIYQHLESIGFYQTAEILAEESGHSFQSNLPLTDDEEEEEEENKKEDSFDYEKSDLRLLVSLAVGYRENAWEISPEQKEQQYIIEKFEANVFSGPFREDVTKIWEEYFDSSKNFVFKNHFQKLLSDLQDYKEKTNSNSFNHFRFLESFFQYQQQQQQQQNEPFVISNIKLSSLRRLILMMTIYDSFLTVAEQRYIFLAIQSLTSSRHFLSLLTYFFECDSSLASPFVIEMMQKKPDLLNNQKKRKIQVSVLTLIRNWVLFNGLSIGADTLNDIMAFCRRVIDNSPFDQARQIAQVIFDTVPTLTNGISNAIKSQKQRNKNGQQDYPQPKIDLTNEAQGLIVFSPSLTILNPKPTEVARQICLIFHKKFATIHTIEFIDGFKNQKTTQRSPTLEEFFVMDNHLTEVVSRTFIEADDKSDAFIRLYKIAKKLRKLLNFNSLAIFCRILLREDVRLLALPPDSVIKELQAMQIDSGDLDQIQTQNQAGLKKSPTKYDMLLTDSTKKGLPSIPNLYAELKKLEMWNKPDLILGMIDVEKILELGSRCSILYYAQNSNYWFVPIPQIQKAIISKDLSFSIEQFEASIANLMEARLNSVLL